MLLLKRKKEEKERDGEGPSICGRAEEGIPPSHPLCTLTRTLLCTSRYVSTQTEESPYSSSIVCPHLLVILVPYTYS